MHLSFAYLRPPHFLNVWLLFQIDVWTKCQYFGGILLNRFGLILAQFLVPISSNYHRQFADFRPNFLTDFNQFNEPFWRHFGAVLPLVGVSLTTDANFQSISNQFAELFLLGLGWTVSNLSRSPKSIFSLPTKPIRCTISAQISFEFWSSADSTQLS